MGRKGKHGSKSSTASGQNFSKNLQLGLHLPCSNPDKTRQNHQNTKCPEVAGVFKRSSSPNCRQKQSNHPFHCSPPPLGQFILLACGTLPAFWAARSQLVGARSQVQLLVVGGTTTSAVRDCAVGSGLLIISDVQDADLDRSFPKSAFNSACFEFEPAINTVVCFSIGQKKLYWYFENLFCVFSLPFSEEHNCCKTHKNGCKRCITHA